MHHQQRHTRRDVLGWAAGSLLAAGLWPGALRADGEGDPGEFHFLAVNDVHYHDSRCGPWLEAAVRQMRGHAEKPEFCLLVGDLADDGKAEQMAAVRDLVQGLGVPTYVVVGNHDYRTQDDRKAFEDAFPGRINYRFEHRGWLFVGLDSTEGLRADGTAVQGPTLRWLDDELPRLDRRRPLVVFTHFPLGPRVKMRPTNADAVLERFKEHNLQAVFGGHFHGFTERRVGATTLTTDRCCSFFRGNHDGTKEKGYFLCHARDGKVELTFVEVKPA
jgi:3',5'-cyclic AMP phosphodiesterase CpdA